MTSRIPEDRAEDVLRGWIGYYGWYYGRFYRSALSPTFRHFNELLTRWAMRKYKRLRRHRRRAEHWLGGVARREPRLLAHERLAKFGLELHPEKTRLLEFGAYAAESRRRAGTGKPETFNFLGFTHICGKKRNGRFTVVRQTIRGRMQAKLSE